MKYLFIINGSANQSLKDQLQTTIYRLYKNRDFTIEYTRYPRHATQIAKTYATLYSDLRIYACGGDGTIHEIANGIYPFTHVQLAIVPIGTGNDFVRSLGYEREDFRHLENYEDPVFLKTDLIKVNNKIAINTVSVGFDVVVAQNVDKFKKIAGKNNAYYLSLLYCMGQPLGEKFQLKVDGQALPSQTYMFIVAGNGRYYGGGYMPCPQANISDGLLDLCFVVNLPKYRIPDLSAAYKKGTHLKYKKFARYYKAKKLQFLNKEPILINLDGEIHKMKQPCVEIVPNQITICLPKKKLI